MSQSFLGHIDITKVIHKNIVKVIGDNSSFGKAFLFKGVLFKLQSCDNSILDKGNEYFHKEDYENAMKCYDEITNDPNLLVALAKKGKSSSNLGRHEKAIECYNRALEIDRNYAAAWTGKGEVF